MADRSGEGSWGWKQTGNNERLVAFQDGRMQAAADGIELAYFGGSCFRVTTPAGLTILVDPWRNPPWGTWDWYLYDFPTVEADICVSTHAHFDHDGVHAVEAGMVVERPVGTLRFADAAVTGIADKHVSDSSHNAWDWAEMTRRLTPMETRPPGNWRSFDNSLVLIETGGLRILHWGDNRPDPPESVWERIGAVDVALLPIDGSWHVLSAAQVESVAARLGAKLIVPHHYGIWDVTTRGSTLLPPDEWVNGRPGSRWVDAGSLRLTADDVARHAGTVLCFGEHVAFEKPNARARKVGA